MSTPHPTDAGFTEAYSRAWTSDPEGVIGFFAEDGTYTDEAMGATYRGHAEILRFHRYMLKFAPDSLIEFSDTHAADGRLYCEWVWSGTFGGPLKLRNGALVDATGKHFSSEGVSFCRYDTAGRLTSHRDFWDLATLLHELDVPVG